MKTGPLDKFTKFSISGQSSDQVLAELNLAASQGYDSVAVAVNCSDGAFMFVGSYSNETSES